MANNKNNPQGFSAVGPVIYANYYNKNTSAAIYPGDAVSVRSDGIVITATAGLTNLLGVAQSYAASTYKTVLVADDPDQQWYCQLVGATGFTRTLIGENADHVATTGNATFLRSRHKINYTGVSLATFGFRILGIHPNDSIGATTLYPRLRVVINEHHHAKKTGGV